jgi:hypothetical protein
MKVTAMTVTAMTVSAMMVEFAISAESFSQLQVFKLQFLRKVSHDSFVFTTSTCSFEGRLAPKLRFHNLKLQFFEGKARTKCVFER